MQTMNNALTRCLSLALLVTLGACTTAPVSVPIEERGSEPAATTPEPQTSEPTTTTPAPTETTSTIAPTLALLDQSQRARTAGNTGQAITYVERAIRMAPRRADLWIQLAQLNLDLERPGVAQQYAHKAIALAASRVDWQRDAWLVIAAAKSMQGDEEQAQQIRQRWQTLRG